MALKSETRTVGQHEYTVTQLGAVKGLECLRRLLKVVGPSLQSLTSLAKGDGAAAFAQGLMRLLESLSQEDLTYFCDTFGPTASVKLSDGKSPTVKAVFDFHFAGNYLELLEWLAFSVEVNFQGFFVDSLKKISGIGPAAPEPPSP